MSIVNHVVAPFLSQIQIYFYFTEEKYISLFTVRDKLVIPGAPELQTVTRWPQNAIWEYQEGALRA